ncbi:chemotaxis protein CheW [Turneriella parva]|uniref:histidine kinase n=1 Tax=Turneriella parva (strain ATCC BAA-1111 / DSM 21527 / NCTC 11395 / H) TaxID=869212 RepID=I4BB40_TURPD|nr:chemotaxis protein CheW [Turneriella parva]AFM14497.1 CheA signal transduction histidine kinase [Turneriella parva DSM 21527]
MQIDLKEVKESFLVTTRELLQRSEALLLEMERSTDAEHFVELLRAIHTIKGNSGIFELDPVIKICHAFETFLEALKEKGKSLSTESIDIGLTVIDRMRALVAEMDHAEKLAGIGIQDVLDALAGKSHQSLNAEKKAAPAEPASGFDRLRAATQKLRLPEKYLEIAKRDGHNLVFIVVDFGDQGETMLSDLYQKFQALHKAGTLLSLGVLRKETITNQPKGPFLPYFIILSTASSAEQIGTELGLKVLLHHYFWQPPKAEAKASAPVSRDAHKEGHAHVRETHLKVHLDLLNTLIDITGEIVLTRNALVRKVDHHADQGLQAFAKKLSYLVTDLQDKVMKTRLQVLDVLFHRFPRLIRETAQQTGKKAELRLEGGDIEIDKAIIDEIADPLMHILRNAVDHGLETPEERLRLQKNEAGTVLVQAQTREGNIVIRVADDGKGLDIDHIRSVAVSKGLITRESADTASEADVAEYLFLPGFSTKGEVTTISGRGVGMDVVRTNISKLGGTVDITGEAGKGTVVTMVIPQTLSILTCLTVEVDDFRFVIPQQNIAEVVTIDETKLRNIQNKMAYELRQRLLPLVETDELLEMPAKERRMAYIVVVRTEKYYFGLRVQKILETEEVVVKTLPQFGQDRQVFSGAAIMGDGRIAPIIDAALVGRHSNLHSTAADEQISRATKQIAEATVQYLLFKLYGRSIAFRVMALPRIESVDPKDIETIVDRQVVHYRNEIIPILPMGFLKPENFEAVPQRNMILLQSEGRRYGLLADTILDIVEDKVTLRREANDRAEIEGYAIIKDETVIVLSLTALMQNSLAATAVNP